MTGITKYILVLIAVLGKFCDSINFPDGSTGIKDSEPGTRAGYNIMDSMYGVKRGVCPEGSVCIAMSECHLFLEQMGRKCLEPNRLRELSCGYQEREVMICCPNGGHVNPYHTGYHNNAGHGSWWQNHTVDNKLNENCGRLALRGWKNGHSGLGSQPWVARVGYKSYDNHSVEYPCCGSIITNKVVLTAAHCATANPRGFSLYSVRVGDYDGRTDPDCTPMFCAHPVQNREISHTIIHPSFEKGTYRHDVALLILRTSVRYSVAVQPICLLKNPRINVIGRRGKIVGWGKLAGQEVAPEKLQEIELPVITLERCSSAYGKTIPVTTDHICLGGEARDACTGFGGAPFVMLDHISRDKYYQVGMVTFGSNKCGAVNVPSVHTRIQSYFDWIVTNLP